MKKILLSIALLIFNLICFAQSNKPNDYIILKTGELITGGTSREAGFFADQIKMGDVKYKLKDIKGFMKNGVYYAVIKKNKLAIRLKSGAINLYQPITTSYSTEINNKKNKISYTVDKKDRYTYYIQKGENGELEKIGVKKFQSAVNSYAKAKKYGDIYANKEQKVQLFKIIGLSSFGGSLLSFLGGVGTGKTTILLPTSGILLASTITCGIISNSNKHSNPANLFKAIDIYNKGNLDTSNVIINKQTIINNKRN